MAPGASGLRSVKRIACFAAAMRKVGRDVEIRVCAGSSATTSAACRLGPGRARHIDVRFHSAQEVVRQRHGAVAVAEAAPLGGRWMTQHFALFSFFMHVHACVHMRAPLATFLCFCNCRLAISQGAFSHGRHVLRNGVCMCGHNGLVHVYTCGDIMCFVVVMRAISRARVRHTLDRKLIVNTCNMATFFC